MKQCSKCKKHKPLESFNKNSHKKDGLQTVCRDCSSSLSKAYYRNHNEEHRERTKKRRTKARRLIRDWLQWIKGECGCSACGYNRHPVSLDFHHLDPAKKLFTLAETWFESKECYLTEIAKTTVVCACCHRLVEAGIISTDDLLPVNPDLYAGFFPDLKKRSVKGNKDVTLQDVSVLPEAHGSGCC